MMRSREPADSYSFFAPSVGPQFQARFTLSTPQGARSEETLETGKSREVGLRLGNLDRRLFTSLPDATTCDGRFSERSRRIASVHILKRTSCR